MKLKKDCVEIPFCEYIKHSNPELVSPILKIASKPLNALQDIKTTVDYKQATQAQLDLLTEVDYFWYRVAYWIVFYRIGNLDRRLKPLSSPDFKSVELFGELYAHQLELTIKLHAYTKHLPPLFKNPLDWWCHQILEIKNDWYYTVFRGSKKNKTIVIKNRREVTKSLLGNSDFDVSTCLSDNTADLLLRSQRYNNTSKNKAFKMCYMTYIDIYRRLTAKLTQKDKHGKSFQIPYAKGDNILLTNQNSKKILQR